MRKIIKRAIRILLIPFIIPDYLKFRGFDDKRFTLKISDFHPQIKDKTITTSFDRHYVYHTSWAARVLKEIHPKKHIDISSSLYFSSIVSTFFPVEFYDYRPAELYLDNLQSKHGDLMQLPFNDNSVESISCMHTIEHVGLGRYGDPMDPNADIKAINELVRVTKHDGSIIFVVPIGKPRIEFNAHRIYSYEQIRKYFDDCELKEFSLIPEYTKDGGLIRNADPKLVQREHYACGCFWFIKK